VAPWPQKHGTSLELAKNTLLCTKLKSDSIESKSRSSRTHLGVFMVGERSDMAGGFEWEMKTP